MKGCLEGDFPSQQVDYVKLNKKSRFYDINGNTVDQFFQEAHISLEGNEKVIADLIKQLWK